MELKEIAAISGKEGLFRILKPARSGVIVETLDAQKSKMAVGVSEKVSILKEISIYTTTQEGSVALEEVLFKIHEKYQGSLPINAKADSADLMAFIEEVLPEYNSEKVYPSDVKKLVKWYEILFREAPDVLVKKEETPVESTETPATETEVQVVDNTPAQTTEVENKVEEPAIEEKPKKTRSTKKKTETTEVENKVEEPATEEKPKKTRSTKKKTETTQEQETTSETEKPKKKSTKTKKEA